MNVFEMVAEIEYIDSLCNCGCCRSCGIVPILLEDEMKETIAIIFYKVEMVFLEMRVTTNNELDPDDLPF